MLDSLVVISAALDPCIADRVWDHLSLYRLVSCLVSDPVWFSGWRFPGVLAARRAAPDKESAVGV